jgi:glycosyltransferase involved in cell wall biosynthesis
MREGELMLQTAGRHIQKKLSIVVPCFNEAAGLNAFFKRLEPVLIKLDNYNYEIICIDDGSNDDTLTVLCQYAAYKPYVTVIELSRNFGKEAALTAGIDIASGDAVIPIDADLQHPPEVIADMVQQWEAGSDMVLAKRVSRESDHPLQRILTQWFYYLHNWMSECQIPNNVGDFRLMDKRVVESLKRLPERKRFMKGLFAWVGFRQSVVEFVVESRKFGKSSFNARRLWILALESITSFSTVPLVVWAYTGFTVAFLALIYGCWIIIKTLFFGIDVPGYASLLTAILFLGGIQLMGIGVLGEYIGRIYSESKQRPVYIIRQRYGGQNPDA